MRAGSCRARERVRRLRASCLRRQPLPEGFDGRAVARNVVRGDPHDLKFRAGDQEIQARRVDNTELACLRMTIF